MECMKDMCKVKRDGGGYTTSCFSGVEFIITVKEEGEGKKEKSTYL